MSTDRQIASRTTRDRGTTGTLRDTPRHRKNILRYTPPRGSLWRTWGHAHRRRERGPGGPAHLAPSARPQAAPGAPSVRARACVPVRACPPRARRHLWEERCALRPGLPGRLGAGGAVAMVRRARPHTNGAATGAAPCPFRSLLPLLPPAQPESPRPAAWPAHPTQRARASPRSPMLAWGLGRSGSPGLRDPRRRPGERLRGARAWGAARPGHGHQTGTAAGSAGAVLETGVAILGGGKIKGEFNPFVARGPSSQSSARLGWGA